MIVVIAKIPRVFNTGDIDQNYKVNLSLCLAILKYTVKTTVIFQLARVDEERLLSIDSRKAYLLGRMLRYGRHLLPSCL